jgi:alpha-L-fucosidase
MTRFRSIVVLFLFLFGSREIAGQSNQVYLLDSVSLSQHPVPAWYEDAKFGIFIHWGLYSVPGYAPLVDVSTRPESLAFSMNPYAEWYYNTMHVEGSPTQKFHQEKYGKDFGYYNFIPAFNEQIKRWDPAAWASLFKKAGAKYVVLTTKHHDGFTLWKSKIHNPYFPKSQPIVDRDIVKELSNAVNNEKMKMGLYYSGGLDWSFIKPPMLDREWDKYKPQTEEYAAYADAHYFELINTYKPALIWNDIDYPKKGKMKALFAHYYNTVPEGVINDRWGVSYIDFTTPEYATKEDITIKKWETCRGLGNSFGYNQLDDEQSMLSVDQLIDLLVDIVSKNGNLLLNVGPRGDGSLPEGQKQRLIGMGKWLSINGEAIYGTRPNHKSSAQSNNGVNIRFTKKKEVLYMILLSRPSTRVLHINDVSIDSKTKITLLSSNSQIPWTQQGSTLTVTMPAQFPESEAYVLRIDKP